MITLGVIALAVLLVLLIINRFIFSWGGLLLSGASLCKYKTISVPTNNGRNLPLAQTYDLHEIARVMKARDGYEFNDQASGGQGWLSHALLMRLSTTLPSNNAGIRTNSTLAHTILQGTQVVRSREERDARPPPPDWKRESSK
jgi:hypothetical protein